MSHLVQLLFLINYAELFFTSLRNCLIPATKNARQQESDEAFPILFLVRRRL